ncbi:hypothetical protein Z949_3092 [Sulfitobacter guttiformis KCTC 32187]|nr:hypothetical protein Z949_3092 [Sulfitobacter guttiformis KCTC 32187]
MLLSSTHTNCPKIITGWYAGLLRHFNEEDVTLKWHCFQAASNAILSGALCRKHQEVRIAISCVK